MGLNFKLHRNGITRIVLLIGNYAIKIPNFEYQHNHFLQGCLSNWAERKYYKMFLAADYKENMVEYVAPSFFCSWFGLVQIQARCEPCTEDLTDEQREFYYPLCGTDFKKENFGIYKGRLVCVDYP